MNIAKSHLTRSQEMVKCKGKLQYLGDLGTFVGGQSRLNQEEDSNFPAEKGSSVRCLYEPGGPSLEFLKSVGACLPGFLTARFGERIELKFLGPLNQIC